MPKIIRHQCPIPGCQNRRKPRPPRSNDGPKSGHKQGYAKYCESCTREKVKHRNRGLQKSKTISPLSLQPTPNVTLPTLNMMPHAARPLAFPHIYYRPTSPNTHHHHQILLTRTPPPPPPFLITMHREPPKQIQFHVPNQQQQQQHHQPEILIKPNASLPITHKTIIEIEEEEGGEEEEEEHKGGPEIETNQCYVLRTLKTLKLEKYGPLFVEREEFDKEAFFLLTREQLMFMKVPMGPMLKILHFIESNKEKVVY